MELLVVSSVYIRDVVMMILYGYCGSSIESTALVDVLVSGSADSKIIILSRMLLFTNSTFRTRLSVYRINKIQHFGGVATILHTQQIYNKLMLVCIFQVFRMYMCVSVSKRSTPTSACGAVKCSTKPRKVCVRRINFSAPQ